MPELMTPEEVWEACSPGGPLSSEGRRKAEARAKKWTLEELSKHAAQKGFWMVYKSPFGADELAGSHVIGFTQHGASGWNGCPDIERTAPTLGECLRLAARALEEHEPGDLDGPQHEARGKR